MELILPRSDYYASYREAIEECKQKHLNEMGYLDMDEESTFLTIENYRKGRNLPEGYVPATYLWLVDDGEFIGELNIRHELTEALLKFGGNIGYWVRPSRWKQGMGTEMLRQSLAYIKEHLGLPKVLITCNDDNIGSRRVIEKNDGKLQDTVRNVIDGEERMTRRYWIQIQ